MSEKKKGKSSSAGGHGHSHENGQECGGHHEPIGLEEATSSQQGPNINELMKMMREAGIDLSKTGTAPKQIDEAKSKNYQFWSTQPVPTFDEVVDDSVNTHIDPDLDPSQIRAEPYTLPAGFEWKDVDVNDAKQLQELYSLLTENYVEDDDNMFRFDYSSEFLKWALQVPGWLPQFHCGVRVQNSGKLVAFISAIPQTLKVYNKVVKMVEINFLCVVKKLRSKRVAPVLIREITRRVNQTGVFQAAFTAGIVIPKPISVCRYWHRSLNPKKLVEVKFSHIGQKMTIARMIKLYKLPAETATPGLRPMEKKDADVVTKLLNDYLKQFQLAPVFDRHEVEHIFLPQADVIYSYVVENSKGKVTDFVSFYCLPSSVMKHAQHKNIKAAYSYYNVADTVPLKQLMNDALILAHQANFDVFNALDLMYNSEILEELKFGIGDGNLQYYLYNWKCKEMQPSQIGLVLQ
ncbi:hypothetical protein WR25_00016 [Diploscapter pachys]|uniref:Glycylpeptide N-tetradecanoyltransferase n=1 Tax=Diploscapter pachys TaxID=2018661 RepID=A0A2A2KDR4_9BILA|nr:hypothetical protein WR25_00016 [Diploscapter pachys]